MDVGQVTSVGLALGGLASGVTGVAVAALNRRSQREQAEVARGDLGERQRQYDVGTIIAGLRATVERQDRKIAGLERTVEDLRREYEAKESRHEATIAELRQDNADCWADRAQLTNQVRYQRGQIEDLRRRVAQVEQPGVAREGGDGAVGGGG